MASSNSVSSLNVVGFTHTPPNNHLSHLTLVTVTLLAVTVTVSLAFYFLLRYRNRFLRPSSPSIAEVFSSANRISPETASSSVADSLPTFAFSAVMRHSAAATDCAVCLSKFEQHDLLRLLPLCCHAFHAECIDAWLRSNLTCPLCRSAVVGSESDLAKFSRSASDSFRLEIGSVSSRSRSRRGSAAEETRGRSYSVGEFEYFIDEEAEVAFVYADRRTVSGEKEDAAPVESPLSVAGEVGRGGSVNTDNSSISNSWLKDYVDRLSSTASFQSSGRFFTGSSRRSDVVAGGDYDVEANRFAYEIGELFRWLSGV
ncbi:hypothetical protein Fmac_020963 [Flemingia macrophylla]|uniref:RING-type E3 ubiquitin transferase n=1 Tax=Flemingia macrophylla TaxID=520843 RepID=A0ABD1LVJ7_9FABA